MSETIKDKVTDYLLNDMEELESVVRELNSWNGCLDHLDVHHNDEDFFNTFFEDRPAEAVRAAHYGEYKYMDEYVRFNVYGNLESLSEWAYKRELEDNVDEVVENLMNYAHHLCLSSDLQEILEEEGKEEYEICDVCGKQLDINNSEDFFVEDEDGSHVYCETHWKEVYNNE